MHGVEDQGDETRVIRVDTITCKTRYLFLLVIVALACCGSVVSSEPKLNIVHDKRNGDRHTSPAVGIISLLIIYIYYTTIFSLLSTIPRLFPTVDCSPRCPLTLSDLKQVFVLTVEK